MKKENLEDKTITEKKSNLITNYYELDLEKTIQITEENEIYFCGDDLYGYYNLEEFIELIKKLNKRKKEIVKEYEKNL